MRKNTSILNKIFKKKVDNSIFEKIIHLPAEITCIYHDDFLNIVSKYHQSITGKEIKPYLEGNIRRTIQKGQEIILSTGGTIDPVFIDLFNDYISEESSILKFNNIIIKLYINNDRDSLLALLEAINQIKFISKNIDIYTDKDSSVIFFSANYLEWNNLMTKYLYTVEKDILPYNYLLNKLCVYLSSNVLIFYTPNNLYNYAVSMDSDRIPINFSSTDNISLVYRDDYIEENVDDKILYSINNIIISIIKCPELKSIIEESGLYKEKISIKGEKILYYFSLINLYNLIQIIKENNILDLKNKEYFINTLQSFIPMDEIENIFSYNSTNNIISDNNFDNLYANIDEEVEE